MATKTAEVHLVQCTDRVVDVPVGEDLGAEDARSCCRKCYSDVEPVTDIPPDCSGTSVVQAQTTENVADESLHFNSLSVERPYQVHDSGGHVSVAGLFRVLGRVREPRGADCGKECGGAAGADQ